MSTREGEEEDLGQVIIPQVGTRGGVCGGGEEEDPGQVILPQVGTGEVWEDDPGQVIIPQVGTRGSGGGGGGGGRTLVRSSSPRWAQGEVCVGGGRRRTRVRSSSPRWAQGRCGRMTLLKSSSPRWAQGEVWGGGEDPGQVIIPQVGTRGGVGRGGGPWSGHHPPGGHKGRCVGRGGGPWSGHHPPGGCGRHSHPSCGGANMADSQQCQGEQVGVRTEGSGEGPTWLSPGGG